MTGCKLVTSAALLTGASAFSGSMAGPAPVFSATKAGSQMQDVNACHAKKLSFDNQPCDDDSIGGQSGRDVTVGNEGAIETDVVPITSSYMQAGLCPVNVHWHIGAEHRSEGEYDESGSGPTNSRRLLAEDDHVGEREGFQCHHYDPEDEKFTKPFNWQHCERMEVGQTYEVHWPHSAAGACGTVNQYQSPFYDGVFCNLDKATFLTLQPQDIASAVGVQAQVFTIVNDEDYYYPDLMRGWVIDAGMGKDIAYYTGSTTGTSRDNEVCSMYSPITWQVDRKCHLISASSFDKMCADMLSQRDDMSEDVHPHGARELVDARYVDDNLQ